MFPVRIHRTLRCAATGVFALSLVLPSVPARSEVLKYSAGRSRVRPYLFVDDNAWEGMDRTRPLPSQSRVVENAVPADPRDYLLRDKVKPVQGGLTEAYGKTVEEVLSNQFLPAFSKLMRMDLGTPQSPVNLLKEVLVVATTQLREKISFIEQSLALPSGPRHVVFMIAPWEKAPVNDAGQVKAWNRGSRYADGQMGFAPFRRTPTRDFAVKHWIYDEQAGSAVSFGQMGNLGLRVREVAERSTAIVMESPYEETPHLVAPYVYPAAFLVHLKVSNGDSRIRVQALLGLQPMLQRLEPAKKSAGAEINHAGVPQPSGLTEDDPILNYPMTVIGFEHNLREVLRTVKMNFDFGTWEGYSPFLRRMKLTTANKAWRMTPYLGGDFIKGSTSSYWTHLRVPVRVHMTRFSVDVPVAGSDPVMQGLETSIELFDRKGGKLIPFPTGIQIGITDGKPTTDAAREIQASVNEMIKQSFAQARAGAKDKALKTFPLAALFIDK